MQQAAPRPLADRLRPQALDEVVGQDHILRLRMPLHHGDGLVQGVQAGAGGAQVKVQSTCNVAIPGFADDVPAVQYVTGGPARSYE